METDVQLKEDRSAEPDRELVVTSRRTDTDIARSAVDVLLWTSYLPEDAVRVKVECGWITLTGEVTWDYQRKAAVDAVRTLAGIAGVSDQIVVKT
jgi:osmotically-inducible protein OsmY